MYYQKSPVIKISRPMKIRIAPPKIPALPASFVPAFLPIRIPAKQIKKVTTPIRMHERSASGRLYSAIVKPTERASIEVAIP